MRGKIMQSTFRPFHLALLALVAWALAAPLPQAAAQTQDKSQQKCLTKTMKRGRNVTKAALKDAAKCIKLHNKATLPMSASTAQLCLAADLKGKVGKARAKTEDDFAKYCGTPPSFAFTDFTLLNDAHQFESTATVNDFFGVDLDDGLLMGAPTDPKAACAGGLTKMLAKVEGTLHKEMERCEKLGLKDGSIMSGSDFTDCLATVKTDVRNKLSKATAKLLKILNSKCPGGDLAAIFPGAVAVCGFYGQPTTAVGISECVESRELCRVCRIINGAHGFETDCDAFDDTFNNGSCPDCPNGVVDGGETCDDGNTDDGDGCDSICLVETGYECTGNPSVCTPICGDTILIAPEDCDDGNTDDGDCCGATCSYETLGSLCVGPPATACTGPGCDGAGSCIELPTNENGACDDGDTCSTASECQSGVCEATTYGVTGRACTWVVVGAPGTNNVETETGNGSEVTGDFCGDHGFFGDNSIIHGSIIAVDLAAANPTGIEFGSSVTVDNDIVTDFTDVIGDGGAFLPGLVLQTIVTAGSVEPKTPSGTYDTTGSDARVAECIDAQTDIFSTTAADLDALTVDTDFGATYAGLAAASSHTINAVNVGGQNVFDFDNFTGNSNVTITLDGGNNADTFFIMRIDNTFDTNTGWTFIFDGLLTPNHVLWYGKGVGNFKCDIGDNNIGGGGTIFCPDTKIWLRNTVDWEGQLLGGDPGGSAGLIRVGDSTVLTYNPFDAIIVP
jgi:cysteine-rich repeat protein